MTPSARLYHRTHGFTLLELLVAITVLSIVSLIAWRGLDALILARARLDPESEEVRALLTVFGQAERDLAQVAVPTLFALPTPAVRVVQEAQGVRLEVVRIAPADESEASALQTVSYRVQEGALWRETTPPTRLFRTFTPEEHVSIKLLDNVRALRVRVWGHTGGWVEGLSATNAPPQPGAPAVPPGVELTIERTDGTVYRRVALVG